MSEFLPPPGFTTVRYYQRMQSSDARETLECFVKEDLKYRDITTHCEPLPELNVECHPIIPDVFLIPVKKREHVCPCDKEIIVDPLCGVAVLRGAHVFAPGIIAAPTGIKQGDSVAVFVDVMKKCLKGSLKFEGKKFFIGNGIVEVTRNDIFSSNRSVVSGIGVRMNDPIYLSPCIDARVLPNLFFPQNLPSIVVGHVLNPPPKTFVLDMCAAPGGKSTHLCSLMHGTGRVIAIDRSKAKIKTIMKNADRLGFSDVLSAYCADSRKIVSDSAADLCTRIDCVFSPPFQPGSFHYILLDAPCSALGQRPRFKCHGAKSELASYPALQWQLFKAAVVLLSDGGTLVYSTCTTTFEENEQMAEKVLAEYPNLSLTAQNPHIGNFGRKEACNLKEDQLKKLQYFDMVPTERQASHPADKDTIGFFIAKFQKSRAKS